MKQHLIMIAVVFACLGSLLAQEPAAVIDAYRNDPRGDNLFRKRGIMDGNQIRTMYFNQGEVGKWPDQPSGEWPKGSGHSYLDGVSVLVGAKVAINIAGIDTFITPIEAAYREHFDKDPVTGLPWGWEPVPGYVRSDSEIPAISNDARSWPDLWPNAIFTFLDVSPIDWVNRSEVDGMPGVDDDRDGDVDNFTYWYGFFGRGVKNADIETFFVMDDAADQEWARPPFNYHPIASDLDRGGLGLRVEVRGFQWSQVLAEDNIFWLYDIVNISDRTYDETVFGFLTDVGIGGTNDSGDDNASFDIVLDIAYAFDDDGNGTGDFGSWGPTGYLGYAYLESPGNPFNNLDDDLDGMVDERRDDGIDNDGDWTPFTDLDGSGSWDPGEPLNDDLGGDGVGPFDRQYNGPDAGEADGIPTAGEPNFDRTDIDESDQIGLNSMSIYRLVDGGGGDGWPRHDEGLWRRMSSAVFDTSLQRANIQMLFASGPFELRQNSRQRFSMALLNGSDLEDLVFNKITVQQIYNADYNFSRPPLKPLLTAVPGDGKVFLNWDSISEDSRDPFLQDSIGNPRKDFEGYLVYRSTEAEFNDIKLITDSRGEPRYWKPIAQFDLINDISGPDPIGVNGARFWRGSNTGIRNSYVDNDVVNGQKYYYAIAAYDQGDPNFGTLGLHPTENTKIIREDFNGNITFLDINTAVVTPNAPAAGYIPPEIQGDLDNLAAGVGTGDLQVEVLDPDVIVDGNRYQVHFEAEGDFPDYKTTSYRIFRVGNDTLVPVSLPVDASLFGEDHPSPPTEGLVVSMVNDTTIRLRPGDSGWLIGSSNLNLQVVPHNRFPSRQVDWPADYVLEFFSDNVDTSFNSQIPVPFKVRNITGGYETEFELWDNDGSNDLSLGDEITIIEFIDTRFQFTYDIIYLPPPNPADPANFPVAGDEYIIRTTKPFFDGDYFEFSTQAASTNQQLARDQMEDVKVVPNPYIVGASWEPRTLFGAGRGSRKLDFIHLPAECTIRIFTISGRLVKTINHNNVVTNGAASWDLISDDGIEIAYGIYIYHVDAPGVGKRIGKFAIVK